MGIRVNLIYAVVLYDFTMFPNCLNLNCNHVNKIYSKMIVSLHSNSLF